MASSLWKRIAKGKTWPLRVLKVDPYPTGEKQDKSHGVTSSVELPFLAQWEVGHASVVTDLMSAQFCRLLKKRDNRIKDPGPLGPGLQQSHHQSLCEVGLVDRFLRRRSGGLGSPPQCISQESRKIQVLLSQFDLSRITGTLSTNTLQSSLGIICTRAKA